MKSLRCGICATNFPPLEKYRTCPQCDEATSPMYQAEPISREEAHRMWCYAEFERRHGPVEVEA